MPKRKRNTSSRAQVDPDAVFTDKSATKLRFRTYEDIADSEDEFHVNRDKILLDGGPAGKRAKRLEDDLVELSDEEVLDYPAVNSEDGNSPTDGSVEDDVDAEVADDDVVSSDAHGGDEDGIATDELSGWGTSKADYYDADIAENDEDVAEEEVEARRIQQKRLQTLRRADFGFDEQEWLDPKNTMKELREDQAGLVAEVLPQLGLRADMSSAEKLKFLRTTYPEAEPLAKQLVELQPLHRELSLLSRQVVEKAPQNLSSRGTRPVELIKYQALSAYLAAIALYFALLTSTAKVAGGESLSMSPADIRVHGIMDSLVHLRRVWEQVKSMALSDTANQIVGNIVPSHGTSDRAIRATPARRMSADATVPQSQSSSEAVTSKTMAAAESDSLARRAERLRRTETSLATLVNLTSIKPKMHHANSNKGNSSIEGKHLALEDSGADSDLGDESSLAPHEAVEKARRKKSLRFYTSQIAQRANKRASAGRAAGGDDDLPYRERFRDRQARLNKEAEGRGTANSGKDDGTRLDGEDESEGEPDETNRLRELRTGGIDEDDADVAQALEARVRAKKAAKVARETAYSEARVGGGRVVHQTKVEIGPNGRRELTYAIEKNKGLMPRRKKEVKNPRVKKRKKFEEKSKKLRTMKATYKGGEGRGGYGGELTGIKKGLVRSTKL